MSSEDDVRSFYDILRQSNGLMGAGAPMLADLDAPLDYYHLPCDESADYYRGLEAGIRIAIELLAESPHESTAELIRQVVREDVDLVVRSGRLVWRPRVATRIIEVHSDWVVAGIRNGGVDTGLPTTIGEGCPLEVWFTDGVTGKVRVTVERLGPRMGD